MQLDKGMLLLDLFDNEGGKGHRVTSW